MASTIHVDVVSAEDSIFSGEAKFVALPGEMGELGIYPRHTPLITLPATPPTAAPPAVYRSRVDMLEHAVSESAPSTSVDVTARRWMVCMTNSFSVVRQRRRTRERVDGLGELRPTVARGRADGNRSCRRAGGGALLRRQRRCGSSGSSFGLRCAAPSG
jgi:hypothetical protein